MSNMISNTNEYHFTEGDTEYLGFESQPYNATEIATGQIEYKIKAVLTEYAPYGWKQSKEPTRVQKADGRTSVIIHMTRSKELNTGKSR